MLNHRSKSLFLVSLLASMALSLTAQDQQIHGRIEQVGSFRLLRVWGSAEEMGYAHGFLLGQEFAELYVADLERISGGKPRNVDQAWRSLLPVIDLPTERLRELEAFVAGARAAAGDEGPMLEGLGRALSVEDLIVYNARDAIRAFGCSGFTLWGDAAGQEGVLSTRNFDFGIPKIGVALQMLMVRHPENGHAVATVTWPGFLGAFTGVSELGVSAFMHDGTGGKMRRPNGPIKPLTLELLSLLEMAEPDDAQAFAADVFSALGPYPYSYLVRIITARVEDDVPPVTVFRLDPQGLSRNPDGEGFCIVTNHYLDDDGLPVGGNKWSHTRYDRLTGILDKVGAAAKIWRAMDAVAADDNNPTVHTLVVYPESRRIELAFATWEGKIVPATKSVPESIDFDRLFALPKAR